jgi:hypothetical protein
VRAAHRFATPRAGAPGVVILSMADGPAVLVNKFRVLPHRGTSGEGVGGEASQSGGRVVVDRRTDCQSVLLHSSEPNAATPRVLRIVLAKFQSEARFVCKSLGGAKTTRRCGSVSPASPRSCASHRGRTICQTAPPATRLVQIPADRARAGRSRVVAR